MISLACLQVIIQQTMKSSNINIKIVDISNKQHQISISSETTGYELKEYVWNHLCKELSPKGMKLVYEGATLQNNMRISNFSLAIGKMFVFHQKKIQIAFIQNINVTNQEDPIYGQKFSHRWPCGHLIGQLGMVDLVKSVIKEGQYKIRCPYDLQNGEKCALQWKFQTCQKIGVFTKEETKYFEKQLTKNWMNHYTKNCPQCKEVLFKQIVEQNRMKCPKCKIQFCSICYGPWNGNSFVTCGNQVCKFANEYLLNAPWDRIFTFKDTKNGDKQFTVKTPKYRACPKCNMIIENYTSCKHTTCTSCKHKFCWICLQLYTNKWPCGSYKQYCGKVSQTQKFRP